jgi:hypothetical protein
MKVFANEIQSSEPFALQRTFKEAATIEPKKKRLANIASPLHNSDALEENGDILFR